MLDILGLVLVTVTIATVSGDVCRDNNPDMVMRPKTGGEEIVNNVLARIEQSGIFPDDNQFMRRLALVETNYGTNPETYPDGYFGGIWQVDEKKFLKAIQPSNEAGDKCLFIGSLLDKIRDKLGVDVVNLQWEDLRCPLVSGIIARLIVYRAIKPIEYKMFTTEQQEFCDQYCDLLVGMYEEERTCVGEDDLPPSDDLKGQAKFFKKNYDEKNADKFLKEAGMKGDPHLSQYVPGSDTPLCYDVTGDDGDVFNFVHEPSRDNLKVTAKLTGHTGSKARYIGEMKLTTVHTRVTVDLSGTTIDNDHYDWGKATHNVGQIRVSITSHSVHIILGLVVITVDLRHGHHEGDFLNLKIQHVGQLPANSKGILGVVASGVRIIETNKGTQASLQTVETGGVVGLELKKDCWHLPVDLENEAPAFNDIIRAQCTSC